VPANLDDTLREHARKGNYILAIGAKFNVLDDEEEVHHVHRKQIDKDLVFLGATLSAVLCRTRTRTRYTHI
jgi:magnesium-transporting ATPase (P-type)